METNNYGVGLYQDGVFYFTNPGLFTERKKDGSESADFTVLWNNREYTFEAKTTVPLVIPNSTPEEIQHIRKVFAKKYAQAWFHTTPRYRKIVKDGQNMPATYDEDTEYGAVIQQCLTPLPKGRLETKELPRANDASFKGTKAIGKNSDLNAVFADYNVPELGSL